MKSIYDEVDTKGKKNITIKNKSLNRKVDIVFSFWYNSKKYEETSDEYYRGIYLYDFSKNEKILDYPFAHIDQVNLKGDNTNDGSRKGIRLLKTLRADNPEIDLNSFLLTTIVHSIDNPELYYYRGQEINIAKALSVQLHKLISDSSFRNNIKSPNGMEKPLQDKIVPDLKKLRSDLDELITDVQNEIYYGYFQKGELIYS